MTTSDWADRKYTGTRSTQAHWVPFGDTKALCGKTLSDWFGTGAMAEYEMAEVLPLCPRCGEKAAS